MMKPGGPGWNDPPKLSHKVHSETKTRRNQLNKRVAYLDSPPVKEDSPVQALSVDHPPPIQACTANVKIIEPQTGCPMPKTDSPPISIFIPRRHQPETDGINPDLQETEEPKNSDDEMSIASNEMDVASDSDEFDMVGELVKLSAKCQNLQNKSATADIQKKLQILNTSVKDGSLSKAVEEKMIEMTRFLLNKRYKQAWDIHVMLMCDHISEVRLWMVGIKRLINELKKNKE